MTMTTNHDLDTVAAFIDGERIDPLALKRALATDEGRDYLVELVAMRELVGSSTAPTDAIIATPTRSSSWRGLAAAAVVALTVGIAGYAVGNVRAERKIAAEREEANRAPMPTREIPPNSNTTWTETSGGHN
jgi:hypothetical protein